jgi:hypothetical protein
MSQSETKTMPEAVKKNPFELFDSPWFKDATKQLCIDGWPTFIVPLNIGIEQAKDAYSALKAECERLTAKIELQRENSIATSAHHEANFGYLKSHYESKNAALVAENADFRAALEFYADKWTYEPFEDKADPQIYSDVGKIARTVISKHNKKD